jgi:hypothetical protein
MRFATRDINGILPLRITLLALLAAVCAAASPAQSSSTYSFLRMEYSGRAAALGGAPIALAGDPEGLFINPAVSGTISAPAASLGFFKHLLDINAGFLAGTYPVEGIGVLSAGILYVNYGSFDETDDLGNPLGTFSANDLALSLGYANGGPGDFHYGGALKFISSQIASYSSTALALDAGVYYTIPESRVTLGASLRNLGVQLASFGETTEDLPLDLAVGATIVPRGIPLQLSLNFQRLNADEGDILDRFKTFTIGGEFTLSRVLQLRFGYNNRQRQDLKLGTSSGLAGFSGGIGLSVSDYRLDYAFSSLGRIGGLHRITLRTTL